ncbi:hypothetical protein CapIbe_010107 [Capra ibex]
MGYEFPEGPLGGLQPCGANTVTPGGGSGMEGEPLKPVVQAVLPAHRGLSGEGEPTAKLGFPGWGKKCSCEERGETPRWANMDGAGP